MSLMVNAQTMLPCPPNRPPHRRRRASRIIALVCSLPAAPSPSTASTLPVFQATIRRALATQSRLAWAATAPASSSAAWAPAASSASPGSEAGGCASGAWPGGTAIASAACAISVLPSRCSLARGRSGVPAVGALGAARGRTSGPWKVGLGGSHKTDKV